MAKNFWKKIKKPIIGLSPMDGYTDSPFRRVCRSLNPELVLYTEFTSAEGLAYGAERIIERFAYSPEEHPIVAQIFGADLSAYAEAARWLEDKGFDAIDINMGCPSRKIVKSEQGVALRCKYEKAFAVIDAVASATHLAVSVKTRLGMDDASDLIAFGKGCQDAGADMIAIHGRTYKQPYGVAADFEPIYSLKEALDIPVLGNGGITSIDDGLRKLGNLDGFLIGQAAMGNPWIFSDTPKPDFPEKVPVILRHLDYMIEIKGEERALLEMRKHLLSYVKGIPRARHHRTQLSQVTCRQDVVIVLANIVDDFQNITEAEIAMLG